MLMPIIILALALAAILCCFESKAGSNSRFIAILVVVISAVLAFAMYQINRVRDKKDQSYHMYVSKIVKAVEPHTLIPLLVMAIIVLIPFYILVITSVKTHFEAGSIEFTWWPKEGFDFTSYLDVFAMGDTWGMPVGRALINSFAYALIPTAAGLFASALSAYAFSKLHFKGRDALFTVLLFTMMMPGCVTMTTNYLVFDIYGWTNSALPIIIPGLFGGAGTVLFLKEYFMGIPDGLFEAASIDGSGKWKSFFYIVLPLGKPAMIAQFVLGFINHYNDFMSGLLYLNEPEKYTIQILLSFLETLAIDASMVATTGVVSLIPMLMLYVLFQKTIIDGIAMSSGIKG